MTPDTVIDIGRQTLTVTVMVAAPVLLAALVTGLLVGVFQAATQINEQTLSFIPKLLAMVIVLVVGGPFMLGTITEFTREIVTEIVPRVIAG